MKLDNYLLNLTDNVRVLLKAFIKRFYVYVI